MTQRSVSHFQAELTKTIDYFRKEYKLSLAEAVGTLDLVKHLLLHENQDDDDTPLGPEVHYGDHD